MPPKRKHDDRGRLDDDNSEDSGEPTDCDELTCLDEEGDVILVVSGYITYRRERLMTVRLLVSSKLLSVASPYFKKLFGPDSREGQRLRKGERPEIALKEDNLDAAQIVLHILHSKNLRQDDELKPEHVEAIAKQCDKYECIDSLYVWMRYWIGSSHDLRNADVEEFQCLAVAAGLFRDRELVRCVITNAAFTLSKKNRERFLTFVSSQAERNDIELWVSAIDKEGAKVRLAIENGERVLREDEMEPKCCAEKRIAHYFDILAMNRVWPVTPFFEEYSLERIVITIKHLPSDPISTHNCGLNRYLSTLKQLASETEFHIKNRPANTSFLLHPRY